MRCGGRGFHHSYFTLDATKSADLFNNFNIRFMVNRTPEQYFDISVADNARANISEVPAHVVEVLNRLSAIGTELVDEMNRRTRFHCGEHFVSNSNQKKGYLV